MILQLVGIVTLNFGRIYLSKLIKKILQLDSLKTKKK